MNGNSRLSSNSYNLDLRRKVRRKDVGKAFQEWRSQGDMGADRAGKGVKEAGKTHQELFPLIQRKLA